MSTLFTGDQSITLARQLSNQGVQVDPQAIDGGINRGNYPCLSFFCLADKEVTDLLPAVSSPSLNA